MKIAIQGFEGSFHSLAARQLYGDSTKLLFCRNFKDVFEELNAGNCDGAVVAIENSLYGSINSVYDLLQKFNFWICGETYETVRLQLLGTHNSILNTIKDVYSQAPALGESEAFLAKTLPGAELHEHADTALAAREVSEWNDPTKAAIAGLYAAHTYNLKVLASDIETHHHNYTRFIALAPRKPSFYEDTNKSSIVLQTEDTPGSLHKVLGIFANQAVNLTKLESRPIIGKAWRYMYYIDFDSGIETKATQTILKELPKYANGIRMLGSYKAGTFKVV